jgi:hypothetical protein
MRLLQCRRSNDNSFSGGFWSEEFAFGLWLKRGCWLILFFQKRLLQKHGKNAPAKVADGKLLTRG